MGQPVCLLEPAQQAGLLGLSGLVVPSPFTAHSRASQSVPLIDVPFIGVPLIDVPLIGVHLMAVPLTGVPLTGVPLTGVHLTGVPRIGVSLMVVLLRACIS